MNQGPASGKGAGGVVQPLWRCGGAAHDAGAATNAFDIGCGLWQVARVTYMTGGYG
ncbi:hypothetical protein [Methylobacterium tarhaniae]|uniref:hypothetical protein n=1 Tax=Methylobacterium tarhaniae TaxID=1187852 RepID=UPI000A6F1C21|nr:hypothetical protein [Methylobacterium tarhaniae]